MKRIAVLGSTGSVGTNALDVIASHPDRLELIGIAAHSNLDKLERQIACYEPTHVAVLEQEKARQLRHRLSGTEVLAGVDGFVRLATHPNVDIVVVATAGRDALLPLLRAIEAGKQIALASKELLVMAGELIMQAVRKHQTCLVPVDSEHSALFQLLQGVPRERVERIVITGSGGPLWSLSAEELQRISLAQVLQHPKWTMGPKITVDSATLMNKGLEVIEAQWLFGLPLERIRVVIHPQAVVHGMVELTDGNCLAHMSPCDMRLPIQYALSFPERWSAGFQRMRWTQQTTLQFLEPDTERFPCLRLALEAAGRGGSTCAVLSAANDVAVGAYLREELAFPDIPRVIAETMAQHDTITHPTLEQILELDQWARQTAQALMDHGSSRRVVVDASHLGGAHT